MSVMLKTTTVVISPILEGEYAFRGVLIVANGHELVSTWTDIEDQVPRVREFIYMYSELE